MERIRYEITCKQKFQEKIYLSSSITLGNIDLREITLACDLNIVRCFHEVHALQRTIGDGPSAAPALRAPSDFNALSISDSADGRRGPETEVINVVDPGGLAL